MVVLDLPGNGLLNGEPSRTRVEEMASFCRAQLMRRAVDPPYHVLGLSLGAMVAVAWAAGHPGEIAGAVLVNTSLRPYCGATQRLRPGAWPALLRLALLDGNPRAREQAVLRLTAAHPPADREALLRDWIAWRRECPVTRANALRQLWAASRYRAPARAPLERLLLLASRGDRLVDPECSRRLRRRLAGRAARAPGRRPRPAARRRRLGGAAGAALAGRPGAGAHSGRIGRRASRRLSRPAPCGAPPAGRRRRDVRTAAACTHRLHRPGSPHEPARPRPDPVPRRPLGPHRVRRLARAHDGARRRARLEGRLFAAVGRWGWC